jgi:hypothetical protein
MGPLSLLIIHLRTSCSSYERRDAYRRKTIMNQNSFKVGSSKNVFNRLYSPQDVRMAYPRFIDPLALAAFIEKAASNDELNVKNSQFIRDIDREFTTPRRVEVEAPTATIQMFCNRKPPLVYDQSDEEGDVQERRRPTRNNEDRDPVRSS